MQQQGKGDCGLFAVAFALHAALGDDLRNIVFDQTKMHSHLLTCFKKKLTSFLYERRTAREVFVISNERNRTSKLLYLPYAGDLW